MSRLLDEEKFLQMEKKEYLATKNEITLIIYETTLFKTEYLSPVLRGKVATRLVIRH